MISVSTFIIFVILFSIYLLCTFINNIDKTKIDKEVELRSQIKQLQRFIDNSLLQSLIMFSVILVTLFMITLNTFAILLFTYYHSALLTLPYANIIFYIILIATITPNVRDLLLNIYIIAISLKEKTCIINVLLDVKHKFECHALTILELIIFIVMNVITFISI